MNQNDFIDYVLKLNINIDDKKIEQLNRYYELLIEYNKVMNLTGITEKKDVYLKHFYDSLTIVKVIDLNKVETLCDIGTGAGFPGLVLKIMFPNLKVTLIDSLNKRLLFLNKVIEELKLIEIETIHSRIEDYGIKNRERYDVVTARAVAPINILLEYSVPLVKELKYFIPLKGNILNEPSYSLAMQKLDVIEDEKTEFLLPFEDSKRTIIRFKKMKKTNQKYPRKNIEIQSKPL